MLGVNVVLPVDPDVVPPDADVAVPPDTTRVTGTALSCPPMVMFNVPLYVPEASPVAFTATDIWFCCLERVPVDGLTVIQVAVPEAVQLLDTIEFLLNVTVWGGGVGLLSDAL
jgi:hypothetical protein